MALCCVVAVFTCYRLDAVRVKIKNVSSGAIKVNVVFESSGVGLSKYETISAGESKVLNQDLMTFDSLSWVSGNTKWIADIKKRNYGNAYITIYNNGDYKQGVFGRKKAEVEYLEGGRAGYFDSILKRKK